MTARQGCASSRPDEYVSLVGYPTLGDSLCKLAGSVVVGPVAELDSLKKPLFLVDPFGPEAWRWARVVPVVRPAVMKVVVAPIGDRWKIVGLEPE